MDLVKDRVALITGGGRGIGEASARRLAEFGAKVILADMNLETAQAAADSYLASARAQADEILENARRKAEQIIGDAELIVGNL